MKIYSIKEIVEATNSFLKPNSETLVKNNDLTKQIKLTNENQVKINHTNPLIAGVWAPATICQRDEVNTFKDRVLSAFYKYKFIKAKT